MYFYFFPKIILFHLYEFVISKVKFQTYNLFNLNNSLTMKYGNIIFLLLEINLLSLFLGVHFLSEVEDHHGSSHFICCSYKQLNGIQYQSES